MKYYLVTCLETQDRHLICAKNIENAEKMVRDSCIYPYLHMLEELTPDFFEEECWILSDIMPIA